MINISNLSYAYPVYEDEEQVYALNNINLNIKNGEFVAIIGHNGSGKSTLAKLLNGIMKPTQGDIIIKNMNTKDEDMIWKIRKTAGMVFQNPENQIVTSIVEEEIAFGPENLGLAPETIRKRVDYALEAVAMTSYKDHAPHMLSGGQKQRIAIAGILAMMPDCIIFDEPTAMLDPQGRKEVMDTIYRLNKEEAKTIVHITHNMEETIGADRIVVMNKGSIALEGSPREVFSHVDDLKAMSLDVPVITDLAYELYKEGFIDRYDYLDENDLVDALC